MPKLLVTPETSPATQQSLQQAIEDARSACSVSGDLSSECATAWDIVEEMQAAAAHRRQVTVQKTALEQYCDEHPDASECRVYDI